VAQQVQPPPHPEQPAGDQHTTAGPTAAAPLPSSHANRQALGLAAVLIIVAEFVYMVVTPLLHPGGGAPIAEFESYADSHTWATVHTLQFATTVTAAFGLLALAYGLNVTSGVRGLVNRFAAATAAALIALNAVLYAVDGVALKETVNAWAGGSSATRAAFLPAVEAIRGVEFGLRGYVAYTTGLAVILLAGVIVSTARVPRVIGYLMGLSGLVYVAQGVGWISLRTVLSEHALEGNISYYVLLLVLVWAIWLLVAALRMKEPDART
jgi:hypothetical protein